MSSQKPADQRQAKPRARYSTSWPAGTTTSLPPLPGGETRKAAGAYNLSRDQWTVLIFVGVVVFIGLALVAGMTVGRTFRGPLARQASQSEAAVMAGAQLVSSAPELRVDPRPASVARERGTSSPPDRRPAAGDTAPGFQLETLDGDTLALGRLKGHAVLINFWATWCAWCKYELPALQAVHEKYQNKGLIVVGVDVEEPRSLVEAYVHRYGVSFPIVLDMEGFTAEAYRIHGLPMTYFVDRDGTIVHVQRGAMREDELERLVHAALTSD